MIEGPIAVTGATGKIGRHLIAHLAGRGTTVRTIGRSADSHVKVKDITDVGSSHLDGCRTLINLAGCTAARGTDDAEIIATNVDGAAALAKAAGSAGLSRVIHFSTALVHGPGSEIVESSPLAPRDLYAESKRQSEEVMSETLGPLSTSLVILRPVAVMGTGDTGGLGLASKLGRIPVRLPVPIAKPSPRRSVVQLQSLISAVDGLLPSTAPTGTYLVADRNPLSIKQFLFESGFRPVEIPGLHRVVTRTGAADHLAIISRLTEDFIVSSNALSAAIAAWPPVGAS